MTKRGHQTRETVVLVGTYKGDQLTKWRGWYNWPVSDDDKIGAGDAAKITELWLFNGKKDQINYKASFVGIKTRQELIGNYGYPAKGKAHGDKYLLFKTDFKYIHKNDVPEDAERVFVLPLDANISPERSEPLQRSLEGCKVLAKPILVSVGHQDGTTAIDAGEIFREALKAGAEEIIVAHNHPSGNPMPSKADIAVTAKLKAGAELVGLTFIDHLVIGSPDSANGLGFLNPDVEYFV